VLEVENLVSGYGRTNILHAISLSVETGERMAILGRNGVGKSTLLKSLIGTVRPKSGSVRLDGQEISHLAAHERARSGIAYVPQGRDIFPTLSVLDNLRVSGFGRSVRARASMLDDVLTQFPILRDKRSAQGSSLSGGQQQILALARALMSDPKVLLLDEPSEGIQPSTVDQIATAIREMNVQRGMTIVLVEQNLEFAAAACDHALIIDKGEVVLKLRTADALTNRELQHQYLGV
jgi:urea ABC transporter ATP-binding protein UrtE